MEEEQEAVRGARRRGRGHEEGEGEGHTLRSLFELSLEAYHHLC
jgi:hypothetical protein